MLSITYKTRRYVIIHIPSTDVSIDGLRQIDRKLVPEFSVVKNIYGYPVYVLICVNTVEQLYKNTPVNCRLTTVKLFLDRAMISAPECLKYLISEKKCL